MNTEATMNITENRPRIQLCSAPALTTDIPLRIKKELAPHALADSEFKQVPTEDLLFLARDRKRVYVTDRASAIAVLKGVVNGRFHKGAR
jgi:hypothetical protein